jgi:hypothetical protein
MRAIRLRCQVAKRDDADKLLLAVHDREPTHLNIRHVFGDVIQIFVVKAIFDFSAHHVPDLCAGTFVLGDDSDRYVTISDHPNKMVAIRDWKRSQVLF